MINFSEKEARAVYFFNLYIEKIQSNALQFIKKVKLSHSNLSAEFLIQAFWISDLPQGVRGEILLVRNTALVELQEGLKACADG